MTTLGRQRPYLWAFLAGLGVCGLLSLGTPQGSRVLAATTEMIVADPNSGLAIYGFDPVAYFTDGKARIGKDDLEVRRAGAAWRFANEGNQAAFAKDPDVYMPQFGGYDPVAVSEGIARPGHPELFTVHNQRLFLFYSAEAKQTFEAAPEDSARKAEANWPSVRRLLAP